MSDINELFAKYMFHTFSYYLNSMWILKKYLILPQQGSLHINFAYRTIIGYSKEAKQWMFKIKERSKQ